ncbi:DUF1152 domain-containing protein [Nocardia sp. NBC_01388]|uniref:DUF1152 domain-containing protein n=1 Tax=Nocardia sp. NBC_01388 TaxID=2903596 RepID=UPI00324DFE3C
MVRTLVIAAGGGGDAITAAMVGRKLGEIEVAAIMSYSWDRLMLDPAPGPRNVADFVGIVELASGVYEISAESGLRSGGRPTLPALAGLLPYRFLLLDPLAGAVGLSVQISSAARLFRADEVLLVDVGGDIIAVGTEASLRTPLADSLVLAAAVRSGLPLRLLVAGVGLDGELTEGELAARLADLGATPRFTFAAKDFDSVRPLFEWHPSEANGLLAAAADGVRGKVETRQGHTTVTLTDAAPIVHEVDSAAVCANSLAAHLAETATLEAVEEVIRSYRGSSEIDFERGRLAEVAARPAPGDALPVIDRYSDRARGARIDYLTLRRVAEIAEAMDPISGQRLRTLLAEARPAQYRPPLYRTG